MPSHTRWPRARAVRFATAALILAPALSACGTTITGPSLPQIAGVYTLVASLTAASCTPSQLPPGGTVILEAFTDSYQARIQQTGGAITLTGVAFPNEPPDVGTVDANGVVNLTFHLTFQEAPREGNRIFFVDLTILSTLQVQTGGNVLQGSESIVNVFHEGSATAPVFTTCTRSGTVTLTRTGN